MNNDLQSWSTLLTGCYGRWWGTLTCTTWTRSSTRWRTSTVRSEPPPPLKQFGTRFFQCCQSFFQPCQGFRGVGRQVVHVACAGDCLLVQRVWLRGSPLPPSHPGLMIILIKGTPKKFIITDEYLSYTQTFLGGRDWAQRRSPSLGLWLNLRPGNICLRLPDLTCQGACVATGEPPNYALVLINVNSHMENLLSRYQSSRLMKCW